ncbi:hypothetical protein [Streptomyces exfoliatus]
MKERPPGYGGRPAQAGTIRGTTGERLGRIRRRACRLPVLPCWIVVMA